MEHLEDEVLNGGVEGTRGAINFLQGLRDMLAGNGSSSVNVTVKWDGAPACLLVLIQRMISFLLELKEYLLSQVVN